MGLKTFQRTLSTAAGPPYVGGMRYVVLGPIAALDNSEPVALGGPLQRAVLAVLLVDPGRPVAADRIIDEVWGDGADDHARASLHTYISNLRRLLGTDRIARDANGYRLVLDAVDEIDAVAFEHDLARARRALLDDPAAASTLLADALACWQGRPYEGMEDVESLAPEIARLEELRFTARLERVDALLRAGDTPSTADAQQLCDDRPLDEAARALLMRTLYRAGRQADALREFRDIRERLGDELGIEPSRTLLELDEQILLQDPALDAQGRDVVGNLTPSLTSFVGRIDEREHLADLLRDHRLVTVTGAGGVGKTRLAVEVASSVAHRFSDGAWLVDLAPVTSASAVATTVAAVLQVPVDDPAHPVDSLTDALRTSSMLLVLDNCEHVADEVGALAGAVLAGTDALTILATSRVVLGVEGEHRVALAGLSVSDDGEPGDAERLFLERSASIVGTIADADAPSAVVRRICEHLDGMPLALELAAARRDVLSATEIAELLARRFAVLVDEDQPRELHRSLEATVGWSWGLLDSVQRQAFADLGVFEGPFTATAAVAVLDGVGDPVAAVDAIERLVAASLVSVVSSPGQSTRYRLLETLRAYARDRLHESDRWSVVVKRHDRYYRDRCRSLADDFFGGGRVAATNEIAMELPEYLAAWDRGLAADPAEVLPFGWPLGNYWLFEGRLAEGEMELQRLLDATVADESLSRADTLAITAWMVVYRNRLDAAIAWTAEALAIYRRSDDERRLAYGLARAGHWAFASGDGERAVAMLQQSLARCESSGFEDGKAWPIVLLAQARRWSGDEDPEVREMLLDARRRFVENGESYGQIHADMLLSAFQEFPAEQRRQFASEMVELSNRPGGENLMRPIALHCLAYPSWDLGEHERAIGLNRAAIRSAEATGATMNLGLALIQAATFAGSDDPERAVTLAAAGLAHFGMEMAPFQHRLLDPLLDGVCSQLGDDRYRELFRIGTAMSPAEAAARAVRDSRPMLVDSPSP